jgi:tRNA U34 5-methylaminomethyl-2-thiouridine-forming methyltransferase MnmC
MEQLQLVTTADGSKTIYNPTVGENYHSKHGALQESKHVFLKSGLEYYLQKTESQEVKILEVGFGTGLNFLLSANYCTEHNVKLLYVGIEAYPISIDLMQQTGYSAFASKNLYQQFLENYALGFNRAFPVNDCCQLEIVHGKLQHFESDHLFDVVYFDAFAAIHQPDMWSQESLERCCRHLRKDGVFVTYAITGNLKRIMKGLGFDIEKAPGAPGKREMLRAIKK